MSAGGVRQFGVMAKKSLGIDISDGQVTAVELTRQGKSLVLGACHSLPLAAGADLAEAIRQLFRQGGWLAENCICGLPLAMLSIRNLTLPFKDAKSIAQTLPFELEEQLITPVDGLVTDFSLVDTTGSGSQVIAFAVEKTMLGSLLEGLQGLVDPDSITPSVVALATRVAKANQEKRSLLLLHMEPHSLAMALIAGETPILYRQISYPEDLLLPHPTAEGQDDDAGTTPSTDHGILQLCAAIERSIDFYRLESGMTFLPQAVVFTGPAPGGDILANRIAATLDLPAESTELLAAEGIECPDEALLATWRSQPYDAALALALQGMGKKRTIDFRQGDFVRKRSFVAARKQLAAAVAGAALLAVGLLGYLWLDYRQLHTRDLKLTEEMTTLYKQTFPSVTRVREPYAEMQAAMKGIQGPGVPTPTVVTEKRVLDLLADLSNRIPPSVSIQVNRLSIDHEAVRIKGSTDTFNAVETIKSNLSTSPRYSEVKIVSATADKGKSKSGGLIRFEIQLQLRGV